MDNEANLGVNRPVPQTEVQTVHRRALKPDVVRRVLPEAPACAVGHALTPLSLILGRKKADLV